LESNQSVSAMKDRQGEIVTTVNVRHARMIEHSWMDVKTTVAMRCRQKSHIQ